jgi:hypothetical protein
MWENKINCQGLATLIRSQQLLVVDMRNYECVRRLTDHEVATLDQLGYGGIVLLEDLTYRTSSVTW